MGSPGQIAGRGWSATLIKPGDKISLTIHPLKDGTRGGQFVSAADAGGQAIPGANRPGA